MNLHTLQLLSLPSTYIPTLSSLPPMQVFWTENHIIMSQSSELLLREMLQLPIPADLQQRIETYIELKTSLGMAEFLSPVYYPFTIASLLNLYDYTKQVELKAKCQKLLDRMSTQVGRDVSLAKTTRHHHRHHTHIQVLAVCLPDGSIVSPSGRSYARHREATQVSPPPYLPS